MQVHNETKTNYTQAFEALVKQCLSKAMQEIKEGIKQGELPEKIDNVTELSRYCDVNALASMDQIQLVENPQTPEDFRKDMEQRCILVEEILERLDDWLVNNKGIIK